MSNKQGPVIIIESCGCYVDHGIPHRCDKHKLPCELPDDPDHYGLDRPHKSSRYDEDAEGFGGRTAKGEAMTQP